MTPDPAGTGDPVHRPRTVDPGEPPAGTVFVRPRTIGALGRPDPMPPIATIEAFTSPSYQPATGSTPVEIDPDLWIVDEPITGPPVPAAAAVAATDASDPTTTGAMPATKAELGTVAPSRLLRNNVLVASGTMLSRLTGLVRTWLVATLLVKALADTYILANNTPNQIYELLLGGVLTATLVPLFTDDLENGDGEATSAVVSFTVVVLVVLALATAALSPLLIRLYSVGSSHRVQGDFRSAGIKLAVLFAPQVFFYGLMALWSAILNARHRFFAAAWAPVLNNVVVIGVILEVRHRVGGAPSLQDVLDDRSVLLLLGLGTSAGIALMALALYPAIRRSGMRLHFRFRPRHPAVKRAVRLSAWTLGYVIANQVAVFVVYILAKPGSGGATDYAVSYQFFQLPHGLLAVSIMVTLEPLLGRAEARADRATFNEQALLGFRLIAMLVIPAAIGYLALPAGLSHGIHPTSGFLEQGLHLGGIIGAFSLGLPGFSTYLYAFRGFYAMKDTRTPFFINCFENALNIATAVVFVRWWGVVGLAASFSVAYTVSACVAVLVLARRSPGLDVAGLAGSWLKLLLAGATMGGFVWGITAVIAPTTNILLAATVVVAVLLGMVTYFGAVYALDVPGISELLARVSRRRSGPGATPTATG